MIPICPNYLQVLPAMSGPPPMPLLSRLLLTLERVEPSSETFLQMLELFLRNKEECKLLEQFEGLAAIHTTGALERYASESPLL
jgi:hypothetical protein